MIESIKNFLFAVILWFGADKENQERRNISYAMSRASLEQKHKAMWDIFLSDKKSTFVQIDSIKNLFSSLNFKKEFKQENKFQNGLEDSFFNLFIKSIFQNGPMPEVDLTQYSSEMKNELFWLVLSHAIVELLCETKDVFAKVDGKKPEWTGLEVFGKNVAARITFCGKDGAINRWSIPKTMLKTIVFRLLKGYCKKKIGFCYLFQYLLIGSCIFEFLFEIKDRIFKNPSNTPGRNGFFKDWYRRTINGKKSPDQESSWTNIGKSAFKIIVTLFIMLDQLQKSQDEIAKNICTYNELYKEFKTALTT